MHNTPKVMIVDDEPLNLDLLEQELEALGFDIAAVGDGDQALREVEDIKPDLILLDIVMPTIDGFEVCRRLKASAATKDIPVIFMTALSDLQDKVDAFAAGGVDYVTKPFQPEEVLARVKTHLQLRSAQIQLREQNTRLQAEIQAHRRAEQTIGYLRDEIASDHNFEEIVGNSPALKRALEKVALVAPTGSTVLILGETGTGKEQVARAIHGRSDRSEHPLVKVNCAALPRELIESELFGHEKGAFSGAVSQRKGRFELAHKGTLFLDEVGELSPEAQAKVLRVLQEQEFERVGGMRAVRVDVRVIAATNRDLAADVEAGRFRSDLFYRLNVFPIPIPPLRERRTDIGLLAGHFLAKCARKLGKRFDGLCPDSVRALEVHSWPGNVRELENVIERAAIVCPGPVLRIDGPLSGPANSRVPQGTLEEMERTYITRVLDEKNWVIEGNEGAAIALGLNPSTLRGRLRKLGIRKLS